MSETVIAEATPVAESDITPYIAPGIGADLWKGSESTFVPVLAKDMPLAQRTQAVRDVLKQSMQIDDKLNLVQGELLYEASKNGYWKAWTYEDSDSGEFKNFETFEEYCEVELDMKRRKAFYLISIYQKFVVELGLPAEVLRELEWSKAKELTTIITDENWKGMLDKTKAMSVRKVKEMVDEMKGASKAPTAPATGTRAEAEPSSAMVSRTFRLHPEQAANVDNALKLAGSMTASEKDGHNLDLICSDFLSGSTESGLDGALTKLEIGIGNIERAFGVKLTVASVDASKLAKS